MKKIRRFKVIDNDKPLAELTYEVDTKTFHLSIYKDTPLRELPLMLDVYASEGEYELSAEKSLRWVRARIIPPNRANIGEILRGFGMEEYDEFEMLYKLKGICCQDDMTIEEIL